IALSLVALLVLHAGILLDRQQHPREGYALSLINLGFVAVLASAIAVHARFAAYESADRLSNHLSWANLSRGILGRWEVTDRNDCAPVGGFPARSLLLEAFGRARVQAATPLGQVDGWWQVEGISEWPETVRTPYRRPAIVLQLQIGSGAESLGDHQEWV